MRCVAQRLNKTVGEVREQEDERADITLSELYRWQKVLEVPFEELLREPTGCAFAARADACPDAADHENGPRIARLRPGPKAKRGWPAVLIGQLIEIMPELKEVAAWPTVGHRRTADELGRIAEHPVPDDWMYEAS